MNIFVVLDGELHTPELDGAILPGITRDSLLVLASSLGYKMHERRISLDEVLEGIDSGRCGEMFACGTAAIVSPDCRAGGRRWSRIQAAANRCGREASARGASGHPGAARTGPVRLDTRAGSRADPSA